MKVLPLIILIMVVLACDSHSVTAPQKSRQMYCDILDQEFRKYDFQCRTDGFNDDILTIENRDEVMVRAFKLMLTSDPETMNQLKERNFVSIRFTDGKRYLDNVPLK